MSDDLHTRIAAALAEAQETHNGISDLDLADAVIRDLKLEREHWQYGDGHPMGVRYRYVTEWEENDE